MLYAYGRANIGNDGGEKEERISNTTHVFWCAAAYCLLWANHKRHSLKVSSTPNSKRIIWSYIHIHNVWYIDQCVSRCLYAESRDTYQSDYMLCGHIIYCNDLLLRALFKYYLHYYSIMNDIFVRPLHFRWQSDCLLLTDSFIKEKLISQIQSFQFSRALFRSLCISLCAMCSQYYNLSLSAAALFHLSTQNWIHWDVCRQV